MLTDQDIKKLTEVQRGVFSTKDDLAGIEDRMATKEDFKGLATKEDLKGLATNAAPVTIEDRMVTKDDFAELKSSFSDLQTSVDRYLTFTEAWHQELTILRSRQDRLAQVLVDKGIVSEKEIALLG